MAETTQKREAIGNPPEDLGLEQASAWRDIVESCPYHISTYYMASMRLMAFLTAEKRAGRLNGEGLRVLLELLFLHGFDQGGCERLLEPRPGTTQEQLATPTDPSPNPV